MIFIQLFLLFFILSFVSVKKVDAQASSSCVGKNIVWLNSYSAGEFDPHFTDWVWSQCSQASLAEVLNAYKNPGDKLFKIVDLEQHALDIGVWSTTLGFLGPFQTNWTKEAADYGFDTQFTDYGSNPTAQDLDTVINTANAGHPVIVSAPGHYLVVWGGDSQYVYTMDSSGHDFTWAPQSTSDSITLLGPHESYKPTRAEFLHGLGGFANYWTGLSIVLTPKSSTSCSPILSSEPNVSTPTPLPTLPPPPAPPCAAWGSNGSCIGVITFLSRGSGGTPTDPSAFIFESFQVLLSVAGGLALLLVMYSGYRFLVSQGKPEAVQQAREQLIAVIVGLLFLIFSLVILQVIAVDILALPGFK